MRPVQRLKLGMKALANSIANTGAFSDSRLCEMFAICGSQAPRPKRRSTLSDCAQSSSVLSNFFSTRWKAASLSIRPPDCHTWRIAGTRTETLRGPLILAGHLIKTATEEPGIRILQIHYGAGLLLGILDQPEPRIVQKLDRAENTADWLPDSKALRRTLSLDSLAIVTSGTSGFGESYGSAGHERYDHTLAKGVKV